MKKTPRRPTQTSSKSQRLVKEKDHVLPNIHLHVAQVAIQKEINILLDVDPSTETIQTTLQLPSRKLTLGRKHTTSQSMSITLPSPKSYTPRTETRQALRTFNNLYTEEIRTPRCHPSTMELDLEEEPATAPTGDDEILAKVTSMILDKDGNPIIIPKTPRHNGWNIKDVKNNYGWGGKVKFMAHVRKLNNDYEPPPLDQSPVQLGTKVDAAEMEQVNVDNMQCADRYIHTCLEMNLTPEPFIIPKKEACAIDLSYYGAGNKPIDALASCLSSIPKLQTLVVRENRLSDAAIVNILQSSDFSRLLTLNLSNNKIKECGTKAMYTFLNSNRIVQTLVLSDCSLHSDFLRAIEEPLAKNPSMTHLDLSKNKLDDQCAEALSTVCKENSNLITLDLSWNCFRGRGASGIADALELNQCLQNLHLGWNGIGHGIGAHCIARALRNNGYLQKLDLTANSINTEGTLALTNVWSDSIVLEILILDQNPIGMEGMRSIFRAYSNPLTKTQGRTIQFDACAMHHNGSGLFDPNNSNGHHVIDLHDARTFWTALEILRLVNIFPGASEITNVVHTTRLESKHLSFHRHIQSSSTDSSQVHLLALANQDEPWRIPLHGQLSFDFTYNLKGQVPVGVEQDAVTVFWNIYSTLEFDSDRVKYIKLFLSDHFVNSTQARYFLTTVSTIDNHTDLVDLLLQKVTDTENLVSLGAMPLLPAKHQSFLNECAGKLLYFNSNLPNGHYSLDMASSIDQRIALRLFRLSGDDKLQNKQSDGINTSQKGNWECFRNETMDGATYLISRASGLPERGVLEFDFVLTSRLPRGALTVSNEQLDDLCLSAVARSNETSSSSLSSSNSAEEVNVFTVDSLPATKAISKIEYEARKREIRRVFGLGRCGVLSKQLLVLADCFHDVPKGRVDCVVLLLNHVLNLDELFIDIQSAWNSDEVKELIRRVGWLNVWCPMYAEMEYTLNLTIWEEHQMAFILAQLGDIEPGENWVDETYNNVFGWELPLSWVQGKIPRVGRLYLRYTTGANFKYRIASAREELKKRTLSGKTLKDTPPPSNKPIEMGTSGQQRRKSIHQITL